MEDQGNDPKVNSKRQIGPSVAYQPAGDQVEINPDTTVLLTEFAGNPPSPNKSVRRRGQAHLQTVVNLQRMGSSIQGQSDYDDYEVPAVIEHAKTHGAVTMAGNYYSMFNLADPQVAQNLDNYEDLVNLPRETCPCCMLTHIPGELVPLKTRTHKMGALGTAVPGFFEFAKFCMLLYAAVLIAYSLHLLIKYADHQHCTYGSNENTEQIGNQVLCGDSWKFFFSSANGDLSQNDIADRLLWLVAIVVMYCVKAYFYRKFRKIHSETDASNTDITDYSVEIRGLPQDICKKDIIDFFAKQELKDDDGKVVPLRVQLINFVFRDTERMESMGAGLEKFIQNYLKETSAKALHKKKLKEGDAFDEEKFISSFDEKMNELEDKYQKELSEDFTIKLETRKNLPKFTGNVYVSFQTMKEADLVLKHLAVVGTAKIFYKFFGGLRGCFKKAKGARRHRLPHQEEGYFYIEKAEFPQEIVFKNLGYSGTNRLLRKIWTTVLNIGFIVGTFILIFLLKGVEFSLDETASSTQVVNILITIVIKIIGFVCTFASKALVEFGMPETTTERNIGIVWRITVSMFFNSALVLVGANRQYRAAVMKEKLYLNVGLVNDLIMLLILSVLEVGIGMVDPQLVINYLSRRKFEKDPAASDEIQKKVNTYYEGGQFDFAVKFSKYLNLMMLAFFTIRLFPMAPLVALIVAFGFYWSDKYYLLRLSKLPELCTVELPLSMLRFFDLALFVWSLGNAAVDDILYDNVSDWTTIMLIITGSNLLLNPNYLLRKLFTFENDESNQAQLEFQEIMVKLKPKTYFQVNPVDKLKLSLHIYSRDGFLADIRLKKINSKQMKSALEPDAASWEMVKEEMKENNSASSPHKKVNLVTNYAIDTPMLTLPPTKQATLETKDIEIELPERQASAEIPDGNFMPRWNSLQTKPTDAPELDVAQETDLRESDINIRSLNRIGASLFRG